MCRVVDSFDFIDGPDDEVGLRTRSVDEINVKMDSIDDVANSIPKYAPLHFAHSVGELMEKSELKSPAPVSSIKRFRLIAVFNGVVWVTTVRSSDMNYDSDSSAEDGDWPKPVGADALRAVDHESLSPGRHVRLQCQMTGVRFSERSVFAPWTLWCIESMRKLNVEALKAKTSRDQEMQFFFLYRYSTLASHIPKFKEYMKEKDKYSVDIKTARENSRTLQSLRDSLEIRYETAFKRLVVDLGSSRIPKTVSPPKEPLEVNRSELNNSNIQGKASLTTIDCFALYQLIKRKSSLLVLDTRSNRDFRESHLTWANIINIPEEVITKGDSASMIGKKLCKEDRPVWDKRGVFDRIVLLDWYSKEPSIKCEAVVSIVRDAMVEAEGIAAWGAVLPTIHQSGSAADGTEIPGDRPEFEPFPTDLEILYRVCRLCGLQWDPGTEYKNPPSILDGGFEEFLNRYPHMTTNPSATPPPPNNSTVNIRHVSRNAMESLLEQCYAIKFCSKPIKSLGDTHKVLVEAYGESALSNLQVSRWLKAFKEGCEEAVDEPSSGRPIRLIFNTLNIPKTIVHELVTQKMNTKKVHAKLVTKFLMEDQKIRLVAVATELLERVEMEADFLNNVTTGDGTSLKGILDSLDYPMIDLEVAKENVVPPLNAENQPISVIRFQVDRSTKPKKRPEVVSVMEVEPNLIIKDPVEPAVVPPMEPPQAKKIEQPKKPTETVAPVEEVPSKRVAAENPPSEEDDSNLGKVGAPQPETNQKMLEMLRKVKPDKLIPSSPTMDDSGGIAVLRGQYMR
ncbi:hypothetical protein AAG570_003259 [Ranatra chinensis]|uniref:USP8 dimerisation domain-containing protein n=1 Tax=Ranatra chinensis TaxID=642074 RepID=A0ABD0Y7D3_9HEMI